MSNDTTGQRRAEIVDAPVRVAWGHLRPPLDESVLRYAKQLGVDDVLVNGAGTPSLMTDGALDQRELVLVRNQVEDAGLRLNGIEQLPTTAFDRVMLGLDGREEQLEAFEESIRAVGRAGIPILGFHWAANGVWRSSRTHRLRGGARATAYDHDDFRDHPPTHGREFTEAELWENYERFVERVVPVAEEAGVRLALHPNDPPIEGIGGVPFIFRDLESFERGIEGIRASPNLGLKFCFGCWSEMAGVDPLEAIRRFGEKVFYVHFRDVEGEGERFNETFVDEGNEDMYEAIRTMQDAGATPALTPDHVPRMEGDTDLGHRAYGFTIGYLRGVLHAARTENGA